MKDAQYLGLRPWDLIGEPRSKPYWVEWASMARIAEAQATEEARDRQNNPNAARVSRPAPGATVKR